jgi:hypothetical protein
MLQLQRQLDLPGLWQRGWSKLKMPMGLVRWCLEGRCSNSNSRLAFSQEQQQQQQGRRGLLDVHWARLC